MATTTTMVHVRVDEQIKAEATETLASMGLSVSAAVRVFLMRVIADKQMPFALNVPNVETRAAIKQKRQAHSKHIQKKKRVFNLKPPASNGYRLKTLE